MPDPDQLVPDLLLFRLELEFIGKGLPAAAATDAEMLAEGLQPLRGRLDDPADEAFHVILFLFVYLDVDDVARNSELHENDGSLEMGEGFSFRGNGFNLYVFQDEVDLFLRHGSYGF